jgi:ketosteroid isomerase-like protein
VSRDDLAVVSRMFACWGEGDLEGMLTCVDPALVWHSAADGRPYQGHDGVRAFFARWRDAGRRLEVPLQRAVEVAPGRILAVGRLRVIRPGRGLADSPGVWVIDVSEAQVTRIESYTSERDAVEALQSSSAVSTGA